MSHPSPTIYLIDNDASVRRALGRVMTSCGLAWRAYDSFDEFIENPDHDEFGCGCIVADMAFYGTNGRELRQALKIARKELPLIFLATHDTDEMRTTAHEAGAANFFRKPVDTQALIDAIQWALNSPSTS